MRDDFLPARELDLLGWSRVFSAQLSADPIPLGITPEQAADYAQKHAEFADALRVALKPGSRTRVTVVQKNQCRKTLIAAARTLARLINAQPQITAAQRIVLGLSVRGGGGYQRPFGPPQEAPRLQVLHTSGRRVRLRINRRVSGTTARPEGTAGICLFSFAGPTPPYRIALWTFERATSRMRFDVDLTISAPAGSKIWLTAFWTNPRGQRGPMADPVSTYIGEGSSIAA